MRPWAFIILAANLLLVSSCKSDVDQKAWHAQQGVVDQFYSKPLKERLVSFDGYPIDQQYAIYLYGNQVLHPPALYLVDAFAANGQTIVAPLSDRLAASENDQTIRDLVMVFSAMNRLKSYNVAQDDALMRRLTKATAKMKETEWKRIVERELATLQYGDSPETP